MRVVWPTGRRITNEILGVKGLTLIKWSDRMGVIRDDRSAPDNMEAFSFSSSLKTI